MIVSAKQIPAKVSDAQIRAGMASILRVLLFVGPAPLPLETHPNAAWKLIGGRYIVGAGYERIGRQSRRQFRIVDRDRALTLLETLDAAREGGDE